MVKIIQRRIINILILLAENTDYVLFVLLHVLDYIDALLTTDKDGGDYSRKQHQVTGTKDRINTLFMLSVKA